MSGRKRSTFEIERERAERLTQLQRLRDLASETAGLRATVDQRIENASEGLRTSFAGEIEAARRWTTALKPVDILKLTMESSATDISAATQTLDSQAATGRRVLASLVLALTDRADAMAQRLAGHVAEAEQAFAASAQLLTDWCPSDRAEIEQGITAAHRSLADQQYTALETRIEALRHRLANRAEFARAQEDKHQKRTYLLRAVRQVCADMGFVEVAPPYFERKGDRGAPLRLRVDTRGGGQVDFALTLDGISSESELSGPACFEDFDTLSRHLDEQFGIHTEFTREDGSRPPKLKEQKERDLPTSVGAYREQNT